MDCCTKQILRLGALVFAITMFPGCGPTAASTPMNAEPPGDHERARFSMPEGFWSRLPEPRAVPVEKNALDSPGLPNDGESRPPVETESLAPPGLNGSAAFSTPLARPLEPLFVKALYPIRSGSNDSNPLWSPSGEMIAFERSLGDKREIIVCRKDGALVQKIYSRSTDDDGEMDFLFPGIVEDISYNAGISWSPNESQLVFMSNGGSGNYDLYLLPNLGRETTIRLTQNHQKDSHPHWSPQGDRLVFVSGRSGKAEIYLMDLKTRQLSALTAGAKTYLYPQWSPDGTRIAMIYGSNENHDIVVIDDITRPFESLKTLTRWEYDDLRPIWSPDGKKIAFYSNHNPQNDPKVWSIIVIAADGSDPAEGDGLAARVVARNVIPDIERGPAWMPDGQRIAYVKNDAKAYHPIYLAHIDGTVDLRIKTDTKMNHDVVCSTDGTLAFRAQTEQWDHIYITRLKEEVSKREP